MRFCEGVLTVSANGSVHLLFKRTHRGIDTANTNFCSKNRFCSYIRPVFIANKSIFENGIRNFEITKLGLA